LSEFSLAISITKGACSSGVLVAGTAGLLEESVDCVVDSPVLLSRLEPSEVSPVSIKHRVHQ